MHRDIFVSVSTDSSSWRSSYPHNITPRSVSTHSCDLRTQSFFFFLKQHVFSSGTCSFIQSQTNISLYKASEGCFSPLCPLIATSNYLWPLLLDQFSERQAFSPCEIFKKIFWEFEQSHIFFCCLSPTILLILCSSDSRVNNRVWIVKYVCALMHSSSRFECRRKVK